MEWVVKSSSIIKKSKKNKRKISSNNDSLSIVVTRCTTRCYSLSLDIPLVCLSINGRIFLMFVNEEVCEIVLIVSSGTDYEFSAAIFIFKTLMWSVYYYHEVLADIERQENYKRLMAYGFHSWQINWYLTLKKKKLFMKTSTASRLRPICSWFSFDSSSN